MPSLGTRRVRDTGEETARTQEHVEKASACEGDCVIRVSSDGHDEIRC